MSISISGGQVANLQDVLDYQGTWDATTNTPALVNATGTENQYYIVGTAGGTVIDGEGDWEVGDWIIFNGTTWDKVDNTEKIRNINPVITADVVALEGLNPVDTIAVRTIQPPAAPYIGMEFTLIDATGGATANPITVDFIAAGQNLHSGANNFIINSNNAAAHFTYHGAAIGWLGAN